MKRLAGFLLAVYVVLFLALTLYGSLPLVSVFARSHVTPLPGGGVEFHDRSLLASAPEAAPLEATPFSNAQFGLELVLRAPHLRMRGPARIVAYSLNRRGQNWLVGQLDRSLIVRHRGREAEFPGAFGTGARQHFVISIADEIVSVHRDGRRFGTRTFTKEIVDWLPGCRLTLGNEVTGLRPWVGELHVARIYDTVLPATTAAALFAAYEGHRTEVPAPALALSYDGSRWSFGDDVPLQLYGWPWTLKLDALVTSSYFERGGSLRDLAFNVGGTIPFGLLLAWLLRPRGTWAVLWRTLLLQGLLSGLVETVQFFGHRRDADLVDIAANICGAMLGVLLLRIFGPRVAQ